MDCRKILETLFAVYLVTLLVGGAVNARTIYVDDDAAGVNNGSSWADAYTFLQDAISEARSAEKPVEIWVAGGVYRPDLGAGQTRKDCQAVFQLIDAVTLKGGFAGSGEPDPEARHVELYQTVLSGDLAGDDAPVIDPRLLAGEPSRAENSYFVVASIKTHKTAVIDGFTITGGSRHGMYNRRGSPTITHCKFSGNQANRWGGRILQRKWQSEIEQLHVQSQLGAVRRRILESGRCFAAHVLHFQRKLSYLWRWDVQL